MSGLNSDDVGVLGYSARGIALLGSDIPDKENICLKLSNKLDENSEVLFHVGKAASILRCHLELSPSVKDRLESALSASSGVAELYFATGALVSLGYGLEAPKVLKALNGALKKDDSITSLGQAFHIASILDGDVSSFFDRVEDAVVQADQVSINSFDCYFQNLHTYDTLL